MDKKRIKWDHTKGNIMKAGGLTMEEIADLKDFSDNEYKIEVLSLAYMSNLSTENQDVFNLISIILSLYEPQVLKEFEKNSEIIELLTNRLRKDETIAFAFLDTLMKIDKKSKKEKDINLNKF